MATGFKFDIAPTQTGCQWKVSVLLAYCEGILPVQMAIMRNVSVLSAVCLDKSEVVDDLSRYNAHVK